jgi:hypothetical protein
LDLKLRKTADVELTACCLIAQCSDAAVTVRKTTDNNSLQWYSLPGNLSGTVYVRAKDADRTSNRTGLDSLSVDHLFITSE